jgi:hypothetical protein
VVRASAACEAAGYPSASITCEGFLKQAAATAVGLGVPNLPTALMPGHIGNKSDEQLRRDVRETTLQAVIDNLTRAPAGSSEQAEPGPRDIVVKGGFSEVNGYFQEHEYSDGLPIVPPTREAIESFLRFTDRDPDEVLGVLLPDKRAATVWSVAVNGVMAGCRPEYMPILVALIEAMADPVRRRAQRQYPRRRHADPVERPHHQGAWLQLLAGCHARRIPCRIQRSAASGASICATSQASCCTKPIRSRLA